MTDLIKRLLIPRMPDDEALWAERREAAAEIERLQEHLRTLADTSVASDTARVFKGLWQGAESECKQLRVEVEQLQEQISTLRELREYDRAEIYRLRPDNERLRAAMVAAYQEDYQEADGFDANEGAWKQAFFRSKAILRRALEPKP